jgi:hypothetical protein
MNTRQTTDQYPTLTKYTPEVQMNDVRLAWVTIVFAKNKTLSLSVFPAE